MLRRIGFITLSAVLGIFFIISAYFKLWPIEPLEYKLADTAFLGWKVSVFVSRIIIAIEFALGVLLLVSYHPRLILRFTIVLLAIFSVYLAYAWLARGNASDCGCMGSLMALTPVQGLLKNIVLILLCIVLLKYGQSFIPERWFIPLGAFAVSLIVVLCLNPVDFNHSRQYLDKPFEEFELNLDTVYDEKNRRIAEEPAVDIRGKKYVLAFMSASCVHCRTAALKLGVISRKNPSIPIYFFINGDDRDIKAFVEQTETSHIPHSRLGRDLFIPLAGLKLPVIYYYDKGRVERRVDYFTLEQYHVEQWMEE